MTKNTSKVKCPKIRWVDVVDIAPPFFGECSALGAEIVVGGIKMRNAVAFFKPPTSVEKGAAADALKKWAQHQQAKYNESELFLREHGLK